MSLMQAVAGTVNTLGVMPKELSRGLLHQLRLTVGRDDRKLNPGYQHPLGIDATLSRR